MSERGLWCLTPLKPIEEEKNDSTKTNTRDHRRMFASDQSGDGKRCRTWQVKFERSTKYPAVSGLIVPLAKFAYDDHYHRSTCEGIVEDAQGRRGKAR
jgi:hypothetical protein